MGKPIWSTDEERLKVAIVGSRAIKNYAIVKRVMESLPETFKFKMLICGKADGVDMLGDKWAKEQRLAIRYYTPDYDQFGQSAPLERNKVMAQQADVVVAIWNGKSRGTKHMITQSIKAGCRVFVAQPPDFMPREPKKKEEQTNG